jgi:hypothetical protein
MWALSLVSGVEGTGIMVTICCTARLLKRAHFQSEASTPDPTTALGNWHAHLIYINRNQLILFVNDNSRLALITPAKDARSITSHLIERLSILLPQLGARPEWILAEAREMADTHIAASRSRSVLGTMNDYKFQIEAYFGDIPDGNLQELEMNLSEVPAGPMKYRYPADVAIELLRQRYDCHAPNQEGCE